MQAEEFFVPSFLNAISEGTEDSLRSVINEPTPGIFTFEMLQPRFCELLVSEVLCVDLGLKVSCVILFLFAYLILIA